MEMIKVKTCDLSGAALDWAVANSGVISEKLNGLSFNNKKQPTVGWALALPYQPSSNWAQCGPLIENLKIGIESSGNEVYAYLKEFSLDGYFGETATVAICRAIVGAKLGEEVEIPKELADQCAI